MGVGKNTSGTHRFENKYINQIMKQYYQNLYSSESPFLDLYGMEKSLDKKSGLCKCQWNWVD
uniref:Uncharacterized protein n=1 Tax=Denticeps clupeoides TaxID=299321 RepID=A0AAY4DCG5_9TELE